jgi:hypothetical protein
MCAYACACMYVCIECVYECVYVCVVRVYAARFVLNELLNARAHLLVLRRGHFQATLNESAPVLEGYDGLLGLLGLLGGMRVCVCVLCRAVSC